MAEPVNLFTIASFFMDDPNLVKKGLNSFESGRVRSVSVSGDGMLIGKIGASMRKKVYDVKVRYAVRCTIAVTLPALLGRYKSTIC